MNNSFASAYNAKFLLTTEIAPCVRVNFACTMSSKFYRHSYLTPNTKIALKPTRMFIEIK